MTTTEERISVKTGKINAKNEAKRKERQQNNNNNKKHLELNQYRGQYQA